MILYYYYLIIGVKKICELTSKFTDSATIERLPGDYRERLPDAKGQSRTKKLAVTSPRAGAQDSRFAALGREAPGRGRHLAPAWCAVNRRRLCTLCDAPQKPTRDEIGRGPTDVCRNIACLVGRFRGVVGRLRVRLASAASLSRGLCEAGAAPAELPTGDAKKAAGL